MNPTTEKPNAADESPSTHASDAPATPAATAATWTGQDADALYGVSRWSNGYFSISDDAKLLVHPDANPLEHLDLKVLVEELQQRGMNMPMLIRFTDILKHRMGALRGAFDKAIADFNFEGGYQAVFPIKVNQQRHVVEEVVEFGAVHGFGLEAGSKPELLAVMALTEDDDMPIVCNGFKDDEFIEAVILATKIGKKIFPVVEKFSELELIVKYAELHQVRPRIGVRVKLSAQGAGRWEQSGGDRSKFGLFITEVIEALKYLEARGMGDCLQLLHFHLGSQINNIRNVKVAVKELTRVYTELREMGAGLQYLDVGGGLGVDYDGTQTSEDSSINYTLQEYANDVVYYIKEVCEETDTPHPNIISESGRAMVAYHSVLVFDVVGWARVDGHQADEPLTEDQREELPQPVRVLYDTSLDVNQRNYNECYHDAASARDEVLTLFTLGHCTLSQRALAERLYFRICRQVYNFVSELAYMPEEFAHLAPTLAATYFCNCSIFQSLPDSWAIDQLFPIVPLHRLDEEPVSRGILADITCDSDGKIDKFIDPAGVKHALELHPYTGEPYYLATFLVGAYQEILGDLHNLLGDTDAVHVRFIDGQPMIEEVVRGDTVREVLEYVQYSADDLVRKMRRRVETALRKRKLTLPESRVLLRFYEEGLDGYTYLE